MSYACLALLEGSLKGTVGLLTSFTKGEGCLSLPVLKI